MNDAVQNPAISEVRLLIAGWRREDIFCPPAVAFHRLCELNPERDGALYDTLRSSHGETQRWSRRAIQVIEWILYGDRGREFCEAATPLLYYEGDLELQVMRITHIVDAAEDSVARWTSQPIGPSKPLRSVPPADSLGILPAARDLRRLIKDFEATGAFAEAFGDYNCGDYLLEPLVEDDVLASWSEAKVWPLAHDSEVTEDRLLDTAAILASVVSRPSHLAPHPFGGCTGSDAAKPFTREPARAIAVYAINRILDTHCLPYRMLSDGSIESSLRAVGPPPDALDSIGQQRPDLFEELSEARRTAADRHATTRELRAAITSLYRRLELVRKDLQQRPATKPLVTHVFDMANNYDIRHGDKPHKEQKQLSNPLVDLGVLLRLMMDLVWVAHEEGFYEAT